MQGLPYRPEAQQWSCQRGTGPSKNKELRQLPRTPPREHQAVISRLPPAAREWNSSLSRTQVKCLASFLYTPLSHPHPTMIKAGKGFSASGLLSWLNILGTLGKIPMLPTVCSPETGRYQKVNYRKLRIGAGNRFNAAVVLEGGRARVPTAQDAAIELHVLLVGPELGSSRCFLSRTYRSSHCLQRRKISMLPITLE